ncbi:MAG: peptidylprolyl isomerase [Sterolibacterium sp.]|nr:peptidylprolyl isomerase [Sterolibacterium sp.]MBP9800345.1 peptidylprolyl isomerase [Sterolibacterium sp.]
MQIAKDTVVTLDYQIHDSDGNLVDDGAEKLVYLHGGYGDVFQDIEEGLEGKEAGDKLQVKLAPEIAFGEYDAELIETESRELFPPEIKVGMHLEREDGTMVTITDIEGDTVVVDGNHPLAGKSLLFACTVVSVRGATAEEIEHRHVHEGHGHTHH